MNGLVAFLLLFTAFGPQSSAQSKDGVVQGVILDYARLREVLYSRERTQEQSQAALLLVQAGTTDAQDVIRESLRRWDRPDVFKASAAAVGTWRDDRYLHPLLQALSSESQEIRQAGMDALAKLPARIVVRWLLAQAEDTSLSIASRQTAVTTLGRCINKSAVVALLSLLSNETAAIRQSAGTALEEQTGQQHGLDVLRWQGWWVPYKDCSDEEWLTARAAFFVEKNRGLQDKLRRAEDTVLEMHQKLFAKTPQLDKVAYCKEARQSDYANVRRQVIAWIGELLPDANGTDRIILTDLLLQLSRDGVEPVQRQAVLALEKVDDPRAVERLLEVLSTGNPSIRAAAAHGLGRYRGSKSAPQTAELKTRTLHALDLALNDPSLEVVANAAGSLGALGATQAAPRLADLLRHPSETVRQSVSFALEQVATVQVLPAVLAGLDDPIDTVRLSLVGVLGKIGGKENTDEQMHAQVLKRLEQVLVHDTARVVRGRAVTVLGDIGGPTELDLLWHRVLATEDEDVRRKAWQAMIEIFSRSVSWPLVAQWDQKFLEHKANDRRLELFTTLRDRWSKNESGKPFLDNVSASLIQAQLNSRKWAEALPLALDMAKRAATDNELRDRLRWLLIVGKQALDDKKVGEVNNLLKATEDLVRKCRDLAPEFESLRLQASQANSK